MNANDNRKLYSCGFLFNDRCDQVLLLRKNRPDWQRGLLNGIGGHVEPGETFEHAMWREAIEEANVDATWHLFTTLRYAGAEIAFFYAVDGYELGKATAQTDEPIAIYNVADLPILKTIRNVPFLVNMAAYAAVAGEIEPTLMLVADKGMLDQMGAAA